jgi:cell division protein FtsW
MGTVVGMVPITGIPLPLISFGGSALIPTLVGIGMLLSFARAEPGAAKALRSQQGRLRSLVGRGRPKAAAVPAPRTGRSAAAGVPRRAGAAASRSPAARRR